MIEWIKNISSEAWPAITAFCVTNGAVIVSMFVSWIKTKIKNFNTEKRLEELQNYYDGKLLDFANKVTKEVESKLDELSKKVETKIDDNEIEREKKLAENAQDFQDALEKIKKTI